MIQRNIVEGILVTKQGEVLLQKKTLDYPLNPGGHWSTFGGEIEADEAPEAALKRELKEELGITIKSLRPFKVEDYAFSKYAGKRHLFIVEFDGDLSKLSLNEGAGFALFARSELDDLKMHPSVSNALKEFFNT